MTGSEAALHFCLIIELKLSSFKSNLYIKLIKLILSIKQKLYCNFTDFAQAFDLFWQRQDIRSVTTKPPNNSIKTY